DDKRRVLDRAGAIEQRPPVHGRCRAPRVHVSRNADENLGAVEGELTDRLREQPVVANGDTAATELGGGGGEGIVMVAWQVVRARIHLPWNPRIDLAIFEQHALRSDEHGCVEDAIGPFGISLEKTARLDVAAVFAGETLVRCRVLV